MFGCLRHSVASNKDDYVTALTEYSELSGLFDEEYIASIRYGERDGSELEIYAASRYHKCDIELKTLNYDCKVVSTFMYSVEGASQTVCIARIGCYYCLKVDGVHI